jgi:hypothetical protein
MFYKKFEKQQTATLKKTLNLGPNCRTALTNAREPKEYFKMSWNFNSLGLGSVAGPVIQATGRSEFEDG